MQTQTRLAEPESVSAEPEQLRAALLAAFFPPAPPRPDLPLRSLAILLGIGAGGVPRAVAGLAAELGLAPEQLRRGLESLVRGGLAVRQPDAAGRRGALVAATEAGTRIIRDLSAVQPATG